MPFLYSSQRLFHQFLWTIQQSSHTANISALETSLLLSSLPPKLPLFSFHNAISRLSWPTNQQPGSTPPMGSLHAADQSQYIANTSSLISRLHPVTARPLSSSRNPTMKAPIRLSQVAVALSFFSSLVVALPPAIQARTTSSASAPPTTRIIINSLTPSSTGTSNATPTDPATETSISPSQPPEVIPTPDALLELRSDPASPVTSRPTSTDLVPEPTALDPDSTITTFAFPSGITNAQEFQEKWYVTTFWSCVTDNVQTHCGWHEPVLPGGDDSVAGAVPEARPRLVVAGAAAVGAAMGWGGWGGWLF